VATRPVGDIVVELLDYKRRDFIRGFKNSVLGEAEDSSSARISEADIRLCLTGQKEVPPIRQDLPTWIGIDMGHNCHIVVGQGYDLKNVQIVRMMVVRGEELVGTVDALQNTYWIAGGLADRHPETQLANAVRDVTNRIILPCEYRGTKEINLIAGPEGPEDIIYIQADRTTLLDEVKRAVTAHTLLMSGYGHLDLDVVVHLRNMVRVDTPETPAVWNKLDQSDHFFHAIGFMLSAIKMRHVRNLKTDVPQTFIGIAGANQAAYNQDIYGNSIRKTSQWQQDYLSLGLRR
jgi:hypothetical protein